MTPSVIELGVVDLIIASGLVVAAGGVSLGLRLGLERRLALAAVRTVVQLLLVGYVLNWVFDLDSAFLVIGLLLAMSAAAGRAAVTRPKRTYDGAAWRTFITLVLCGLTTTFVVTSAVIRVDPWYQPQYVIPILGMVLGNGLTGISLCLDTVLERFANQRDVIEMELAHGATPWEASRDTLRDAVRSGMIPIINSMMVVGIVSLPGMMTGQILSGVDPIVAVQYQIVVMFMIAGATSFGCIGIVILTYRRLFNDRAQLKRDVIRVRR